MSCKYSFDQCDWGTEADFNNTQRFALKVLKALTNGNSEEETFLLNDPELLRIPTAVENLKSPLGAQPTNKT